MKVKYQQIYSNECGLCAIKNLLKTYNIPFRKIELIYDENGTTILNMAKELKKYFFEVEAISFDIDQLKNIKSFSPYITLIRKNNIAHYVVIFKVDKKYIYILDSLYKKSYKLTYSEFNEVDMKLSLVPNNKKLIKFELKNNKKIFIMPLITLIESFLLLSTTILIQQIIDNGIKNAFFYIMVQLILLLIITIKAKLYLKFFKILDRDVIHKTLYSIYNLKNEYINRHSIDEVYYRINDAYTYKSMILSSIFNIISDVLLSLATISLMFVYSYILAILLLFICLIVVYIAIKFFKKTQIVVEQRRTKEYLFFNYYRDSFKNKDDIYVNNNNIYLNDSSNKLIEFQSMDYQYEKIKLRKNIILSYFQSLVISIMVLIYFSSLYEYLSVGSLIALINLSTLMLQPILNICSEIVNFSNYKLIKQRLEDINENVK